MDYERINRIFKFKLDDENSFNFLDKIFNNSYLEMDINSNNIYKNQDLKVLFGFTND
jgi:hypothetical protein